MSNDKSRRRLTATSLGAIASAIVQSNNASASDTPKQHQAPLRNWLFATSTTNDVGCVKTTIPDPNYHLGDSHNFGFIFTRTPELDVENLTDSELSSCGLPIKRRVKYLPRSAPEYQAWLKEAHDALNATQLLPWGPPPNGGKHLPPPPFSAIPYRTTPPPEVVPPYGTNHSSNDGANSVSPGGTGPGGWQLTASPTFAGREITDESYAYVNGDAAYPQSRDHLL